jgi:prostaglandin-H2 D-isomerase / glutathione transferase
MSIPADDGKNVSTNEMTIKLSYFPIEGFAECIRLALILSGKQFDDDRVAYSDWFQTMKSTTPYGNLPVMTINNGPMRTQSKALLRWVGATFSDTLYRREQLLDIEESIGVIEDMMQAWRPIMWPFLYSHHTHEYYQTDEGKQELQPMREKFVQQQLPIFVQYLIDLMDQRGNGIWLASIEYPTIADCFAVPFLRGFTKGTYDFVPTNCLDKYPKIVEYIKRFCALEPIKGRYTDGVF